MSSSPPPWNWNVFGSIRWQAFLSAATAFAFFGLAFAVLGPAQNAIVRVLSAAIHEVGHFLAALATGAQALGMKVNANGSGHAVIATSSPLQSILTAASGMLMVALVASFLGYSGLTRRWMHAQLAAIGTLSLVLCALVAEEPVVCLVFLGVGGLAVFIAYMPGVAFLKSVATLYIAIVLTYGLLLNLGYAYAESVPAEPEPIPSDSQIIATALEVDVLYVGNTLLGLIALIFAVAAILVASWLQRNE